MITWGNFVADVKALAFPDRAAENLSSAHTRFIVNGVVLAQKWIPCLRESNVTYYDVADMTIACGMGVIAGPRGRIHAVYAFKPETGCTRKHYTQVSTAKLMCFVDDFAACECATDTLSCNSQVDGAFFCEDDYVADYVEGTAEDDSVFKCRDRQFAVAPSGTLIIAPRIPCGYRLGVMWEGEKRSWSDSDVITDDPELIDLIAQYLRGEHAQMYDRDLAMYESIMRFDPDPAKAGSFWKKLSWMASECREERRVRQERNCEVFFDDGAILGAHPPMNPVPVIIDNDDEDDDGGGTGGIQRVFRGSFGDPNGNQEANGAAIYYDDDGSLWYHATDLVSNTDWVALIAA